MEAKKPKTESLDGHQSNSKKRHRRTADEIERKHCCPIEGCSKSYGYESALKMHMRLKHPDASKNVTTNSESVEMPGAKSPKMKKTKTMAKTAKEGEQFVDQQNQLAEKKEKEEQEKEKKAKKARRQSESTPPPPAKKEESNQPEK